MQATETNSSGVEFTWSTRVNWARVDTYEGSAQRFEELPEDPTNQAVQTAETPKVVERAHVQGRCRCRSPRPRTFSIGTGCLMLLSVAYVARRTLHTGNTQSTASATTTAFPPSLPPPMIKSRRYQPCPPQSAPLRPEPPSPASSPTVLTLTTEYAMLKSANLHTPHTSRRHVEPPKLVVLASTQRGGSTELAEIVGMHPCGASFNELLVRGPFPVGYSKYKHLEGGIPEALNQQIGEWARYPIEWSRYPIVGPHLQHHRWLDDALRVRDLFCSSRPRPVKDHCGNTCVVALKMHLNKDVSDARDEPWLKLITSPDVGVVVAQRGGVDNYCSITAAQETQYWGHNSAQCKADSDQCARAAALKHQCNAKNSTTANTWSAEIDLRFDVVRQVLSRAGRPWLDVPFEQFVAEGGGAPRSVLALRVLDHLSLGDPEVWDTCGLPWCVNYSWPWNSWTNFNWSKLHNGTCGSSKCYFPESTPVSPGPSGGNGTAIGKRAGAQGRAMGWLVEKNNRTVPHRDHLELSDWMKAWQFATDLHTRYGANHLLLEPPRRITLGDSDAALLNAHLWNMVHDSNISARYAEGHVLVQPVRSCPPPSCLLMGCGPGTKAKSFVKMLAAFLENVHDKATFIHALEQNVRSLNATVRVTKCLHRDFQAFVRNDGQIFQIDLDRCILRVSPLASPWTDDCLDNALAVINTEIIQGENRSD